MFLRTLTLPPPSNLCPGGKGRAIATSAPETGPSAVHLFRTKHSRRFYASPCLPITLNAPTSLGAVRCPALCAAESCSPQFFSRVSPHLRQPLSQRSKSTRPCRRLR